MKSKQSLFALLISTLAVFTVACGYSLAHGAEVPPTPHEGQLYVSASATTKGFDLSHIPRKLAVQHTVHAGTTLHRRPNATSRTLDLAQGIQAPFVDVPADAWFAPYVQFVHQNGVMQGTTATTFTPNANFERAQVVATLFRIYHDRRADASDPRETPFSDVPADGWFAPYVAWAYHNGIVSGVGEGLFAPLAHVDRQQLATMLFRFADELLEDVDTNVRQGAQWSRFTDRDRIQSWAVRGLTWANYHSVVNGRTDTSIVPNGTATRAEAAAMLTRFADVPAPSGAPGQSLGSIDATEAATVVQPANISWYKRLFNQHNRVGSDFSPPARRTLTGSHVSVDARIYEPLTQMMASARAAGATIWAQSGYRSYTTQRELFENRVNRYMNNGYSRAQAEKNAALWIAAPGTSEHQSGLAVDFNCITMAFEQTVAYQWLIENAHRYGFILRYPRETTHITGVNYEPWHFRYVGVEHASMIWDCGVTLEEYVTWYFGR